MPQCGDDYGRDQQNRQHDHLYNLGVETATRAELARCGLSMNDVEG